MGKAGLTSLMWRGAHWPKSYGPRWRDPGRRGEFRRSQWSTMANILISKFSLGPLLHHFSLPSLIFDTLRDSNSVSKLKAVLHWFLTSLERPIMAYTILYDLFLPTSPFLSLLALHLVLPAPATSRRSISSTGYVSLGHFLTPADLGFLQSSRKLSCQY